MNLQTLSWMDEDLVSIQEARILAEHGREAQKQLARFSQAALDEIVTQMAQAAAAHVEELARLSQQETGYGRWQDKLVKNRFACTALPEALRPLRCVGLIAEDKVRQTAAVGVPLGLVAALPPATSPVSATIAMVLVALKAGNALVVAPHPRAKRVIGKVMDSLIAVAELAGLPEGALGYLHTVTTAGTEALLRHPATAVIINTGVPELLPSCRAAGKMLIYGSNGHGPAFIERTADIRQAVEDILISKTFDYGMGAGAEQAVVVDRPVAEAVRGELERQGAYFLTAVEAERLNARLFPKGKMDDELVGQSAASLAAKAGVDVPKDVRLLVLPRTDAAFDREYRQELLCPVLAWYVEDDWQHACEKCIELLLTEGTGHTLVIHSQDEAVIRQFVLQKPVGRVLVNTPAVLGSVGLTTNLFPAFTLGSASAGQGMMAANLSPEQLIYVRRVGYGVRSGQQAIARWTGDQQAIARTTEQPLQQAPLTLEQLVRLMLEQEIRQKTL